MDHEPKKNEHMLGWLEAREKVKRDSKVSVVVHIDENEGFSTFYVVLNKQKHLFGC